MEAKDVEKAEQSGTVLTITCTAICLLFMLTVGAIVSGILFGFIILPLNVSPQTIMVMKFPGEVLMRMLTMSVLPLVVSSLISGITRIGAELTKKIGLMALTYYFVSTLVAVITGIILVLCIHRGDTQMKAVLGEGIVERRVRTSDAILDFLRNAMPDNIVVASFEHAETKYVTVRRLKILEVNDSDQLNMLNSTTYDYLKAKLEYTDGVNLLGITVFCTILGVSLSQLGSESIVPTYFFGALDKAVTKLVTVIMWYSPLGILCLVMARILETDYLPGTAWTLGLYILTVLIGLGVHLFISMPLIFLITTHKNPHDFMPGLLQAWMTAIGTSSSFATLPITFNCVEENLNVDRRVSRFVISIGSTVNMDGTALCMAAAATFIAQLNGVGMSFLRVIGVSFTVTLAAMCSAAVPSAGLILVLTSMGLPIKDASLLLLADRILDRIRESINVVGNAFGAVIINHHVEKDLRAYDVLHADDFNLNGLIGDMKPKKSGGTVGDKKANEINSPKIKNAPSKTTNAKASYAIDEISVEMPETVTNPANTGIPAYGTPPNANYSKTAKPSYAPDEISVEMPETVTNPANTGIPACRNIAKHKFTRKQCDY